jgi:hypothetical protein
VKSTVWARASAALLVALLVELLGGRVARAGEPKLAPDEGIVLCKGVATTLRYVEYWRVGARKGFYVSMRDVLTPRVVKAGRYYLHTYTTIYRNVFPPRFPEPTDMAATIDVEPGSVTYFGDLSATPERRGRGVRWNFSSALTPATLQRARQVFPWLEKYPLYVPKQGGGVIPVRWSTEPLLPKPIPGEQRYGSQALPGGAFRVSSAPVPATH